MDPTSVGHYGTLVFLSAKDPEKIVTAYPIDSQTVTIGRDPSCDIRLYYADVSATHCKLVFSDRKAFLVVLGQNGVDVDDCTVFPSEPPSRPTTIPLSNHSTLEIHSKRFRFEYPPKHARAAAAAALSTPAPIRRRMSLITANKVFTSAPSPRPLDNLRVLQSPLRPYAGAVRQPSPLRGWGGPSTPEDDEDDDVEDEEVVLVDGDHPRVVQEDKDLVIMEDLPALVPDQPLRHIAPPAIRQMMETPPRRKPAGRPSLHRAVLLRSAQRVVQDVREEMEVEESVLVEGDISDEIDMAQNGEDGQDGEENGEEEIVEEAYERMHEEGEQQPRKSGWRKSLEAVWPFGRKSEEPEETREEDIEGEVPGDQGHEQGEEEKGDDNNVFDGESDEEADVEDNFDEEDEENEEPAPLPEMPSTPIAGRRNLGQFMTPQAAGVASFVPSTALRPMHTPRRAVDAWRVRDLVVPAPQMPPPQLPSILAPRPPTSRKVSVEEEQAIRARRQSAVQAPLSPLKPTSRQDVVQDAAPTPGAPLAMGPPARRQPRESDESDSGALLESMRRTVNDLRRRSIGAPLTPGPLQSTSPKKKGGFSLFPADEVPMLKGALDFGGFKKDDDSSMEVDDDSQKGRSEDENESEDEEDKENVPALSSSKVSSTLLQRQLSPTKDKPPSKSNSGAKPPSSAFSTSQILPPETPDLAPLRHMFAVPHPAGVRTPALNAVKGLYNKLKIPETPAMDGVAEMLAPPPPPAPTPAPEPVASPTEPNLVQEQEQAKAVASMDEDEVPLAEPEAESAPEPWVVPVSKPKASVSKPPSRTAKPPLRTSAPTKPPSSSQVPARPARTAIVVKASTTAGAGKTAIATPDASTMADDELTPVATEAPARRSAASTTTTKSSKIAATKTAGTVVKRRRPPGLRDDELPAPVADSSSSRPPSRTTVSTPDPTDGEKSVAAAAPSRRANITNPTKPPSKNKISTPATEPIAPRRATRQTPVAEAPPTAPPPARRSTRSTPAKDGKDVDVPSDNEPSATGRVRRTARGKAPVVETVKEEEDDNSSVPETEAEQAAAVPARPPARAPSRSGAKTPTTAAGPAMSRTRASGRKTPIAAETNAAGDKENTPEGAGSSRDHNEDDQNTGGASNGKKSTRTTRPLKTPITKSKSKEDVAASTPAAGTRSTRVTRARK